MKVVFIMSGYPRHPVGGYRVVYEYANHLVARGHEVTVVHPRRLPNWPPKRSGSLPGGVLRKTRQVRDLLVRPGLRWQWIDPRVHMRYVPAPTAQHVPDAEAVIATAWATAELVMDYPASKGEKFYLIQHYESWKAEEERVEATWRAPLHKVVIAQWLYEKGLEIGVPAHEMVMISDAINQRVFHLEKPIEGRASRVAMLFSMTDWKGARDGMAALELARRQARQLEAVLFGVPRKPRWIPTWMEYHRNPRQDFLVGEIYNRSALYLCPSWSEGWGLPPAEAMACGCAVVSTDNGGVRDYAVHGETALLSPPRDPDALANNVVRLLKNDALRVQLAQAGNKRISQFAWERSTDLLERYVVQHVDG